MAEQGERNDSTARVKFSALGLQLLGYASLAFAFFGYWGGSEPETLNRWAVLGFVFLIAGQDLLLRQVRRRVQRLENLRNLDGEN